LSYLSIDELDGQFVSIHSNYEENKSDAQDYFTALKHPLC